MTSRFTVYVVDDDDGMRESLHYLLTAAGYRVVAFRTGDEFLNLPSRQHPCCLVLDLCLASMDGIKLHKELKARGMELPTIMISGRAEINDVVEAVRDGVLDFLAKPFNDHRLLDLVALALAKDEQWERERSEREAIEQRLALLTGRERELMEGVIAGKVNKVIAAELGLSHKTVEYHRKNVMEKLGVGSVPELVKLVLSKQSRPAGTPPGTPPST